MFAEFRNTLRRLRGAIIGWAVGVFLYDAMISSFYSSITEMGDEMLTMLENYPPEMMAFFPGIAEFTSPIGYINTYYSDLMTVIFAIFGIVLCAKLLVGDEEDGILDLVISYPISRTKLFWGRLLAFLVGTIVVLLASWLGWLLPAESAGLPLTAYEMLLPNLPILVMILLYGSLTLLFSLWLPSTRFASSVGTALAIGNFLLVGLSGLNEELLPIYEKTPFYFNQGAKIIEGVKWEWLGGMTGIAVVLFLLSWWVFSRRDIRVGGEAGWQFSGRLFSKKKATA
jgi:ABC-2 type transport system permease protein